MRAKTERYRRVRGAVLKLLAHSHPGAEDIKVIYYLLDDLRYTITTEELRSHITYLVEKEYVSREVRKTSGVKIEMVVITSKGLDLLDGFTEDVGVDTRF